jgi:hypothetical protein
MTHIILLIVLSIRLDIGFARELQRHAHPPIHKCPPHTCDIHTGAERGR